MLFPTILNPNCKHLAENACKVTCEWPTWRATIPQLSLAQPESPVYLKAMEKLEDGCSQVEVMFTLDLDIETMKKLLEDYKTLQSYTKEKSRRG